MATFDLTEYLEDDTIVLEGIRSETHPDGKAYRFESPSAQVGLWLKNLVEFGMRANLPGEEPPSSEDLGKLVLDDDEERDLYRRVMGATLDELLADKVSWGRIQKVFRLLLLRWGANREIGQELERAKDGHPEAAGPGNRAARRAARKTAGSSSSRASTDTPARTRGRTSTRSSRITAEQPEGRTA